MGCLKLYTDYNTDLRVLREAKIVSIAKSEKKAYRRLELTNQVGSVLATLSDYKTYNVTLSHYEAVVLTATEYGVYGEVLEHREYAFEKSYTRGFNGALKEDELLGEFNAYDLGARMYRARLGRQLSTDPRELEYAWQSTYAYYGNSPISTVDFMGMGGEDEHVAEGGNIKLEECNISFDNDGQEINDCFDRGDLFSYGYWRHERFTNLSGPGTLQICNYREEECSDWNYFPENVPGSTPAPAPAPVANTSSSGIGISMSNVLREPVTSGTMASSGMRELSSGFGTGGPMLGSGSITSVNSGGGFHMPQIGPAKGMWAFCPLVGSGQNFIYHMQQGNYGKAAINAGLFVSDCFFVKSVVINGGRVLLQGGIKFSGSHSLVATKAFWNKTSLEFLKGGSKHHWLITQSMMKKYTWLRPFGNQTWNIIKFESHSAQMRLDHGVTFRGVAGENWLGRLWHGTPIWFKSLIGSYGGRAAEERIDNSGW